MEPNSPAARCVACGRENDPAHACVATTERSSRVGEVLGERYQILRAIGAGGMGEVYEARHKLIDRRVAVKLLHPEYARQPAMLARFHREARAAGSLQSEHIAAVTDFGVAPDGAPFLVMELLEGEDLAAHGARVGPLPVVRAVSLAVQACRGLAAAHASDIVHRDLKPANLFLTRRGDGADLIKVLDFGIAKLLDADESSSTGAAPITGTGKLLGTAHYMPPEQAKGQSDIDARADVYALGAILYELLTATKAHPGANHQAVLFHILTQSPDPLRLRRPDVPAGLARVIERAMAPERADRYARATDLIDALLPYAGEGPIVRAASAAATAPAHAGETLVAGANTGESLAPIAAVDTPAHRPVKPLRPRAALWLAAGLTALAAVASLTFFRMSRAPTASSAMKEPAAAPSPAAMTTIVPPAPVPAAPIPAAAATAATQPSIAAIPAPDTDLKSQSPQRSSPSRRRGPRRRAANLRPAPNQPIAPAGSSAADDFDTRNPYKD